jgi:hypothetical protein
MLARIVRTCLIGTIGFLAVQTSQATSPGGVPSLLPEEQTIYDAARISDPVTRDAALRDAIRKGLLETPPGSEVGPWVSRGPQSLA